jgi:hypothetical protein
MFLVDLLKLLVLPLQLRDPVAQFFFPGPAWLRTDPFSAPVFQSGFSHFLIFQGPGADLLVLHFDKGKPFMDRYQTTVSLIASPRLTFPSRYFSTTLILMLGSILLFDIENTLNHFSISLS